MTPLGQKPRRRHFGYKSCQLHIGDPQGWQNADDRTAPLVKLSCKTTNLRDLVVLSLEPAAAQTGLLRHYF